MIFMAFVCHSYVIRMFSYVIRMYSYATRIYLYVIRMSLVYTCMSSVCYLYVTRMYSYITSKYSYVICMSLVCGFTMNQIKQRLTRKCISLASRSSISNSAIKWLAYGIILYRKKVI